jgi:hypothetical protein
MKASAIPARERGRFLQIWAKIPIPDPDICALLGLWGSLYFATHFAQSHKSLLRKGGTLIHKKNGDTVSS